MLFGGKVVLIREDSIRRLEGRVNFFIGWASSEEIYMRARLSVDQFQPPETLQTWILSRESMGDLPSNVDKFTLWATLQCFASCSVECSLCLISSDGVGIVDTCGMVLICCDIFS